ncbi:hypothetical protein O5511_20580 [Escherichia coli]|nr:hypothetical protein [Escherichia coli]
MTVPTYDKFIEPVLRYLGVQTGSVQPRVMFMKAAADCNRDSMTAGELAKVITTADSLFL